MSEPIKTKRCSKCKDIKAVSEFYKNSQYKDGLQCECKQCRKEEYAIYRKTPKAKELANERVKKYYRTVRGRNKIREYQSGDKYKASQKKHRQGIGRENSIAACKRYKINNREKIKAHDAVKYAIRKSRLPKAKTCQCFYCDEQARDYHHWHGYDKQHHLDVIPVCSKCHKSVHNALVLIAC